MPLPGLAQRRQQRSLSGDHSRAAFGMGIATLCWRDDTRPRTEIPMNTKPTRILWLTDFSKLSLAASQFVSTYRDAFNAELHLLHICTPLMIGPGVEVPYAPTVQLGVTEEDLVSAATSRLKSLVAELFPGRSGIVCSALAGVPWSAICDYASHNHVDLIVMATHGLTGIKRVLIGSTAERVVQHAPCPVLTVKSQEPA